MRCRYMVDGGLEGDEGSGKIGGWKVEAVSGASRRRSGTGRGQHRASISELPQRARK